MAGLDVCVWEGNVLSGIGICFLESLTCLFLQDFIKGLEKRLESRDSKEKLEKKRERLADGTCLPLLCVIDLYYI